jgi:hypothetical protein
VEHVTCLQGQVEVTRVEQRRQQRVVQRDAAGDRAAHRELRQVGAGDDRRVALAQGQAAQLEAGALVGQRREHAPRRGRDRHVDLGDDLAHGRDALGELTARSS